jgi:hypothetical protein
MKKYFACLTIALALVSQTVSASVISVTSTVRALTPLELGDGAPAGSSVYEFFVDTDTDILQVDQVSIAGALYQNGFGTDDAAPNPAFVAVFPALGADSYITTPGGTAIAGGGFGDGGSSWFDTDNNGAQAGFKFAQLTVPTTTEGYWFSGRIQTKGVEGPSSFLFSLPVPEPTTLGLAGMGLLGIILRRRS